MSANTNLNTLTQSFNDPDDAARKAIYQAANETHNVALVRQMNNQGMKPSVPPFSGPTIISNFMDIATKHDIIRGFLKKLRETNRLLTEEEFQDLSAKNWIKKNELSRILGCDHLIQKIVQHRLTRIKVPLKVAVVKQAESLKVLGWEYSDNLYDIHSKQIAIFARRIPAVERKLSRVEIDELIQIVAAANFVDLWLRPQNIVIAEDGIYLIDTEFKSFAGSVDWGKMERFESLISEEDKSYFKEQVQKKIDEPRLIKTKEDYDTLIVLFKIYKKCPELKYKDKTEEVQKKVERLKYVGAKKAGRNWIMPNKFSFNLSDILTKN